MNKGQVNIVIPLYNQAPYIIDCLRSVVVQSYRNFTVTVVNDGSTDQSASVALDFIAANNKEGRIKLISQVNGGLSAARNVGITACDGEFILPLDADDYIDADYLETTVPRMINQKVGIVSTDMVYFGTRHEKVPPTGITLEVEMLVNGIPVCSLIRRTAFEQTDGYQPLVIDVDGRRFAPGYEDWNLWLSIMKRGWSVSVVNEPLFHYRIKTVSMVTECKNYDALLQAAIRRNHPELYSAERTA